MLVSEANMKNYSLVIFHYANKFFIDAKKNEKERKNYLRFQFNKMNSFEEL